MSNSTEIVPMQAFTERLREALRDDVARMMPDEVLAQMIQSVIQREFFEGKKTVNSYGNVTSETPPKFHAMIIEALKPQIEAHVAKVLQERAKDIDAAFDAIIDKGVLKTIIANFDIVLSEVWRTQSGNWGFQQAVVEALRKQGIINR